MLYSCTHMPAVGVKWLKPLATTWAGNCCFAAPCTVSGALVVLTEVCTVECGVHGRCSAQRCLCDEGWSGTTCDHVDCDPRCTSSSHGHCNNGTCICQPGWNGRHCTLGPHLHLTVFIPVLKSRIVSAADYYISV